MNNMLFPGIEFHNNLNSILWNDWKLDKSLRLSMLKIVKEFLEYVEINNLPLKDIIITGSNVGYNYSKYSDIDLHLVIDFDILDCSDILEELLDTKRVLWNKTHSIKLNNISVEIYVENYNTPAKSNGVFSVLHDKWVKKPSKYDIVVNKDSIKTLLKTIIPDIKEALLLKNKDNIENILDDLYRMRQSGLQKSGEFSEENIAFKIIRNKGYLDELKNQLIKSQDSYISSTSY